MDHVSMFMLKPEIYKLIKKTGMLSERNTLSQTTQPDWGEDNTANIKTPSFRENTGRVG